MGYGIGLQGEELEPARKKAEAAGVKDIFIDDLREEFVSDYVFPMFRCTATQTCHAIHSPYVAVRRLVCVICTSQSSVSRCI